LAQGPECELASTLNTLTPLFAKTAAGAGVLLGEASQTARLENMFGLGFASTNASAGSSGAGDGKDEKDTALVEYPAALRVKNTFLEFPVEQLLRLDGSVAHRRSRSCPARLVVGGGREVREAVAVSRCSSFASLATEEGVPDFPRAWVGSVTDQLQCIQSPPLFPATSATPTSLLPQPPAPPRWSSMPEAVNVHGHMYPSHAMQNALIDGTAESFLLLEGYVEEQLPSAGAMGLDFPAAEGTAMSVVWAECSSSINCGWAATTRNNPTLTVGPEVEWQRPKESKLGSPELPTVGSRGHHLGKCKPCVFVHRNGCSNGVDCAFCHLCDPDEKKRRQKERWEKKRRQWRQWRHKQKSEANNRQDSSETDSQGAFRQF